MMGLLTKFMPRAHCGPWTESWITASWVANFLVFVVFCGIGGSVLSYWWSQHRQCKHCRSWAISLGGVFLLCGLMHLLDGCLSFVAAYYKLWTVLYWVLALWSVSALRSVLKHTAGMLDTIAQSERNKWNH